MRIPLKGNLLILLLVLLVFSTGCGLLDGLSQPTIEPVPIQNTAAPAPTVDTGKIAAEVLEQVESSIDAIQQEQTDAAVDQDALVATVLQQVENYLAQQEEPAPTALQENEITVRDLQETLIELYQKANPAVVFIIVPPIGSGSGFVFSDEGYIVTNNHVIEFGQEFEVVFSNGERRSAELTGRDVDSDLAVIKVEELPASVEPLPVQTSSSVQVGQLVAAIGNPFGEQGSMSLGIVSGLDRSLSSQRETDAGSSYSLPQVIQTDAPINPGNSGGPLLNLDGEVIGVNSAIATTTGTNSGVGFSIPSDAVLRIIPSLIDSGSYDYPYMGVSFDGDISLDDLSSYGLSQTQGAYVISVTPGGPGDVAGLRPGNAASGRGGDLIIDIDGIPINDFSDLNSYLVFNAGVGQTIEITVLRDGAEVVIPLTLGARPVN